MPTIETAALERQLREHPDDVDSWQVYGDLLQERGDSRGELIHAGLRPDHEAAEALIARDHKRWAAALPAGVKLVSSKYGFATKVSVIWQDAAAINQMFASPELRFVTALRIGQANVDSDTEAEPLERDEDGRPIPPPVDHRRFGAFDEIAVPQLRELDLRYLRLGATPLPPLPDLQILDVRYCALGDDGAAQLVQYPKLKTLKLQRNFITAKGIAALNLPELVELDLRYNRLGDAGVQALAAAPFLATLKQLDVYRNDITEPGIEILRETPGNFLRKIWASWSRQ